MRLAAQGRVFKIFEGPVRQELEVNMANDFASVTQRNRNT
jgi:hypothetical protein